MVIEINRVPNRPRTDPRERQEWFRQLDELAQDVVRQRWIEEELDWERLGIGHGRDLRRHLIWGALLVGGIHLCIILILTVYLRGRTGGTSFLNGAAHVLVASMVGAALGWGWRRFHAGVLSCAISSCLVLVSFELVMGLHWIFAMCAGWAAGLAGGFLGLRRTELPGS